MGIRPLLVRDGESYIATPYYTTFSGFLQGEHGMSVRLMKMHDSAHEYTKSSGAEPEDGSLWVAQEIHVVFIAGAVADEAVGFIEAHGREIIFLYAEDYGAGAIL